MVRITAQSLAMVASVLLYSTDQLSVLAKQSSSDWEEFKKQDFKLHLERAKVCKEQDDCMETKREEVQAIIERLRRIESAFETKNSKGSEADVSSPSPPTSYSSNPDSKKKLLR